MRKTTQSMIITAQAVNIVYCLCGWTKLSPESCLVDWNCYKVIIFASTWLFTLLYQWCTVAQTSSNERLHHKSSPQSLITLYPNNLFSNRFKIFAKQIFSRFTSDFVTYSDPISILLPSEFLLFLFIFFFWWSDQNKFDVVECELSLLVVTRSMKINS